MLHGTGGDEREMLAFGRSLLPGAPVLAPRGRIREGGAARFFSRTPQDPFRFPDLPERIDELAAFVGRPWPPTAWRAGRWWPWATRTARTRPPT